ncbi:hypothetical protein Tco_0127842 [Tanacetum coccineum]
MSSDDVSSTVTYTSSSGSREPSAWDPIELDEHVPLYVPEHPEHHDSSEEDMPIEDQPVVEDAKLHVFLADSDSMEDDTNLDSIDYPYEPEDGEDDGEAPEEDPKEDETAATPPSPGRHRARIIVRPQPPMAASTQTLIDAFDAGSPLFPSPPPINPTYNQAPLGHRAAMTRMRDDILEEDMPPRRRFVHTAPPPGCDIAKSSTAAAAKASRGQYDFVDAVRTGQGLVSSLGHDARTITRAANKVEDVATRYRLKRESEDFYTQLLDARTDSRDIRLEVDVVRGQRTAYETELQEVRQAYPFWILRTPSNVKIHSLSLNPAGKCDYYTALSVILPLGPHA